MGSSSVPQLLRTGEHEAADGTELSLREAFAALRPRLRPPFPLRSPSSPPEYHQLILALACGALSDPPRAARAHLVHLHAVVSDGYSLFTRTLLRLSLHCFPRLLPPARAHLLSATSELIAAAAVGVDRLVISLLRWVQVGDFSAPNLWLAEQLLGVLSLRWSWLLEEPSVLTSALFVFLRLLSDHYRLAAGDGRMDSLKSAEVGFCVRALREQFHLCAAIGRDLVRLLQDLVAVPEFRRLWEDLLLRPADISGLYRRSTPAEYLLMGISPEMETKMRFLLSHVKTGSRRRYLEWFAGRFLRRPEQEAAAVDLVRFVCCAHHPPNEVLRSDVVPRWMVVGWLLTACRKNYFAAGAKLALFYDWLFFDEANDSIMNIEPAILLMVNSVPEYVGLTQTLMEFLLLLADHYDEDRRDLILQSIRKAFREVVRKGVVQSLDVLSTCSLISPALRESFTRLLHGSNPAQAQAVD